MLDPQAAAASIRPDPGSARSWVEEELNRPEYRRSLGDRLLSWLGDRLDWLQASALNASPLSAAAAVLLLVLLAVLAVAVASRVRREPLRPYGHEPALGAGQVSAQEHRDEAQAALAAGEVDRAIVEAFRAMAARAVQRGVLEDRPGRTAHELAADLGPILPALADDLERASAVFDLVYYGDRIARSNGRSLDRADAQAVLDLDDALLAARPGPALLEAQPPAAAVPR